ncbi:hypothetical protein ACHAO1_010650 [Botrytis cinerea]
MELIQLVGVGEKEEIAKLLLDRGADVNAQGGEYGNALQAAAWKGNQETVKLLLDRGADVNAQGGYHGNALQAAAWIGNQEIVKLLLDRGADVNAQGGRFGNALQAAAWKGNQETVKLLLDRGADVNAQGGYHGNALQAAAEDGNQEMVKLLLDRGADITIQPRSANRLSMLHVCVASGSMTALKLILDAGGTIHLDTQDQSGQTPLHVAVEKRDILAAKYLLERGGSTDIPDLSDTTPFQLAIQSGFSQMALLMFSKTKYDRSSLSATDWRRCLAPGLACHIEMTICEPPEVLVWNDASKLRMELNDLSYPLSSYSDKLPARETDFMSRKNYAKRIFMVLKSGGNDQNLVQELLKDAQLLELLIANLKKQVNKFRIFKQQYTSDAWRVLHEHTPGQLKEEMDKNQEFNLTSIAEAQKSTRTNRSMKRLSWITFIFLPLLFIASLFGMNVDILENNPAWWWYIPLAALLMFITFTVWIIFKRSEGLEDNLEQRFDRLFRFGRPFRQNKEDVERGLDQSEQIKRKRTAAYSTSGKKRS